EDGRDDGGGDGGGEQRGVGAQQGDEPRAAHHSAGSAAGGEQGDREDDLLGRDPAVQEGAAIARLVLAQLGGIDEEAVRGREQHAYAEAEGREPPRLQVFDRNRGLWVFGAQVLAEFVAQVLRGVALGEYGGRRLAVDRAVVGGEQHGDAAALRLGESGAHRRTLEPRARQPAQRVRVACHLVEDRALGPAVCELVDEVEHQGRHAVLREVRRELAEQLRPVVRREQLLIAHGHRLAEQVRELLAQELGLVRVQAFFIRGLAPPLRVPGGDLHGEHAAEDRVARERRRAGHDAVVVRLLEVAQRLEQAGLLRGGEPHLPACKLDDQLDPLPPRQRRAAPRLELAEPRHKVARQPLLADAVALEQPGDDGEDLARVYRLHE